MKTSMTSRTAAILILCLQLLALPVEAAAVGDQLPAFTLKDQAGVSRTLEDGTRRIYATADRQGDKLMKAAMASLKQTHLDAHKAVVVADISKAPGFVKAIIRSSLKDRSYSTWMDVGGSTASLLPYRTDQIAVIELDQRRITAIRYLTQANALTAELLATPASEPK